MLLGLGKATMDDDDGLFVVVVVFFVHAMHG
jgi:hypothetical protein